ncbi:MAG: hypothetical protein IPM56_06685 [Ignavibacteriales bacterium]|nr:MAG: hypothetical protein IPM56_06685 [Ignavibacteriales bacterium]
MAKLKTKKYYSVITGDIVKSSKLPVDKHKMLIKVLRNCSAELPVVFPGVLKYEPELFRGDSWQLLIQKPETALSVALFYRAYLKAKMQIDSIDARMAISFGTVDIAASVSGTGEAYKISGKALDKKGRRKMKFVSGAISNPEQIDLIVQNTDFISSRWTSRQSKIILLAIQNKNQKDIARKLRITQQAVSQHLDSAGWTVVLENILYYVKSIAAYNRLLKTK